MMVAADTTSSPIGRASLRTAAGRAATIALVRVEAERPGSTVEVIQDW